MPVRADATSAVRLASGNAALPAGAATGVAPGRSDSRLPGARHTGLADRVLDRQTGLARLRLGTQASRDRVEEPAHERQVRVQVVQLLFYAIDRFDQIVLIAAWEGHARDGKLNGNQRLMYCGLLLPIHEGNLNRIGKKPQVQKNGPAFAGGAGCNVLELSDCYFAGAFAEESLEEDFFEEDFLWCEPDFLWLLAGAEAD